MPLAYEGQIGVVRIYARSLPRPLNGLGIRWDVGVKILESKVVARAIFVGNRPHSIDAYAGDVLQSDRSYASHREPTQLSIIYKIGKFDRMQELALSGDDDRTLVGQITQTLADRIVSGSLAPGARLRQDHIAAEFKASHVPVREAFRRLEAHGLVESEPRRGTRVAALDDRTILEVIEMRAVLESLALRHSLPLLRQPDVQAAKDAIAADEASTDLRVHEAANRQFHRALIRPCGMPRLLSTIDDLHRASARFLFATWRELDWQRRSDSEHRAILTAAEGGDAEWACSLLEAHIREAGRALIENVVKG